MCGTASGCCGGITDEREEEPTGARGTRERVKSCPERRYCLKRNCHCVKVYFGSAGWLAAMI